MNKVVNIVNSYPGLIGERRTQFVHFYLNAKEKKSIPADWTVEDLKEANKVVRSVQSRIIRLLTKKVAV